MKSSCRAVVCLAALAYAAHAQTDGVIEGRVLDPSDAALVGAEIVVVESSTGAERRAVSDQRGAYLVLGLGSGDYRVSSSAAGFRSAVRDGVVLAAGRTARVDFRLEISAERESVLVEGDAPLVSAAASDWGGLVPSENLENLPLNGRDLFELAKLEPGAVLPPSARNGIAQGFGLQISVNGSRPDQNSFQIDGVFVNDAASTAPASASGDVLGLETVREVRLTTNPFDAAQGRTVGGAFTAVSRSGGNDIHGSLYEYFRNDKLDARNFFDSHTDSIPPLRRNQFGAVVSGPAIRDRLFYLANYEGMRQRRGRTVSPVVPDADARQGFLPQSDGSVKEVVVAESVKPYLDLYPLPNGANFGDGTAAFVNQSKGRTDEDYVTGKLDALLNDATRLNGRYTFTDGSTSEPDPMGIWTFLFATRHHFFHSSLQRVESPNTIWNLRGAFSRVNNAETSQTRSDIPPELSFVPGLPLGTMTVTGLSNFGGFQARARPRQFVINSYQFSGDWTHIHGRHTLRAGGGFDRIHFDQQSDLSAVGSYTFRSLENLLLANAAVAEVMQPGSDTARGWRNNQFFWFVQDDFRVGPNLSISLGLRWEAASTPGEIDGKIATLPDLYRDEKTVVGGPVYRNPSWSNFAPRASLAWDPSGTGKTVVRAGGGLFYDLLGSRELVIAGVRMPPFYNRILIFGRPEFPDILGAAEGRNPSASIDGLDYDMQQPYVARWQLNLERQLGGETVGRVGYSGMRGLHLLGQVGNFNTPIWEIQPDGRAFFPAGAERFNKGFSRIGLRRSQFNSFYHAVAASVESRFGNRVRFQAKYAFSKSIDESSSGTFNDFVASDQVPTVHDYRANRGLSDFDLRHVFAGNLSWEVSDWEPGVAGAFLGGWQIHSMALWQSGTPFAPSVGFDQARLRPGFGDVGQRPDLAAAPGQEMILGDPSRWFDPNAFSLPEAGYLGNLGRGTLRGPGLFSIDFAAHKIVWRNERQTVRFRAELFNVTNHPNFQIPSSQELFNSQGGRVGSAGRITGTTTGSRQVQLALRWEF